MRRNTTGERRKGECSIQLIIVEKVIFFSSSPVFNLYSSHTSTSLRQRPTAVRPLSYTVSMEKPTQPWQKEPSILASSEIRLVPRSKEGEHPPTSPGRIPPSNPSIRVLYHDPGRYIVLNKPADVRMDGDFHHTVEKLVLHHMHTIRFDTTTDGFRPRFVHRLDYATSGVLLVGLSKHAAAVAASQFERRDVKKVYIALVHGVVAEKRVFDAAIADTVPRGYRMTVGNAENAGRKSMTECVPVGWGTYHGARVTKVRLEPWSGRRHQLRVHLAAAGTPIVGDATYIERDEVYFGDGFMPPRMMLHAEQLRIRLPERGKVLHGRKSGLKEAVDMAFDGGDPFVEGKIEGFVLKEKEGE